MSERSDPPVAAITPPLWAFRAALSRKEAAEYVSVSMGHWDKLVAEGIMPKPLSLSGVKRWRRADIDDALSNLSRPLSGWAGVE